MPRMSWAIYLWPGLPQMWLRGNWSGLIKAIGAAIVLNVVLLESFGWSELIGPGVRKALWGGVGLFWVASATVDFARTKRHARRKQIAAASDPFAQALDLYLKGDSFQAERMLTEMLRREERDLEARLLLATLYRHARRFEESSKHLDILCRFEGAEKWALEIERERTLLAEAKNESDQTTEMPPVTIPSQQRISHAA